MQQELFAPDSEPVERPLDRLGQQLWRLAAQGVYLGSSSWKYDSWKGTVYNDAYRSKKDFEERCLAEYARVFPAVGGDFSFYNWPSQAMLETIGATAPAGFKIALKATEFVTLRKFPRLPRWGSRAGADNPDFLDARLFSEEFLTPVSRLAGRLAPIIVEFTAFPKGSFRETGELVEKLEAFFAEIGRRHQAGFEFGIEFRSKEFLDESVFAAIAGMNARTQVQVAPIVGSWTRTLPMPEQLKLFERFDFPFLMCRPVMRPGRTRDEAVALFEPYDRLKEVSEPVRRSLVRGVEWALSRRRPFYGIINNHVEGCATATIEAVATVLQ